MTKNLQKEDVTRRSVIISFVISALIGSVFWWYTTRVYRASIPFDEIQSLPSQPINLTFRLSSSFHEDYVNAALNPVPVGSDQKATFRIKHVYDPTIKLVTGKPDQAGDGWLGIGKDEDVHSTVKSIVTDALGGIDDVVKGDSELTFSLLLDSECSPVKRWEFTSLLSKYMPPFLERDHLIISSQIQHFADSTPVQQKLETVPEGTSEVHLDEADLANFVNVESWSLDSVLPQATHLNFIFYISSADVRIGKTNGFLIPGWGSVVVIPESMFKGSNGTVGGKPLSEALQVVLSQVRRTLGVPQEHQLVKSSPFWESQSYDLRLAAAHAQATVRTLLSFKKLVEKHSNMVISDKIAALIDSSLKAFRNWDYAESYKLAQMAYFDDTMVGLMYFPDEHKLAVYTPFFFPALFPLVVAVVREARRIRQGAKAPKSKTE